MNRVLSDETSRCVNSSQEFITKKLCISSVFVFAFFSFLGGFVLGKFVSGKHVAEHTSIDQTYPENVNQFLLSINKLSNVTNAFTHQHSTLKLKLSDSEKLQRLFQCNSRFEVPLPIFENFTSDVSLASDQVVNNNLMVLQTCYNNISNFLENFFITTGNSK